MALIALDIGGTKIAGCLFSEDGKIQKKEVHPIGNKKGGKIGHIILNLIDDLTEYATTDGQPIEAVGACIPGIYDPKKQTAWAPNLAGWEAYPLYEEIAGHFDKHIPVRIDSDRSCYILGEAWQGNAVDCENAIYIAIGTGIGAGIMVDGRVLRGTGNCAGAIGWMALSQSYQPGYSKYGCFEYHASGEGLVRVAQAYLKDISDYKGVLWKKTKITSRDIFKAYKKDDAIARRTVQDAVQYWGMGVANMVSIFNPQKIILGGGVFEAADRFLDNIIIEARRWAQPIAFKEATVTLGGLGSDAGLYGSGYLALSALKESD